jgi:transposase
MGAFSMSRAYSQDLRDRVLVASAEGSSARWIAARFGIGVSTAIVWIRREKELGVRSALVRGQPKGSKLDVHEDFLRGLIAETPDITLHEIRVELKECLDVSAAIGTIWKFFDDRDITFKKNSTRRGARAAGRVGGSATLV